MKITEIIREGDDNIKGRFYSALKGNQPVILAYGEGSGRNLDIHGQPVSLEEWHKVMSFALSDTGKQYNDFHATRVYREFKDLLYALSIGEDEVKFIPGREGSVVLYIQGPEEYLKELADEIDHTKEEFRVDEIHFYPEGRKGVSGPALRLWWD
jgi:hypothetical protein